MGTTLIAALKNNQPGLLKDLIAHFLPQDTYLEINKGMVELKSAHSAVVRILRGLGKWPGLKTLIRVESERQLIKGGLTIMTTEVRYYIASFQATAQEFARRIRGYWGVENKVHYVRDVTQGEDKSRIRTTPLVQIFAVARNFALNLYRSHLFSNMAQAQRKCTFGIDLAGRQRGYNADRICFIAL